MDTDPTTALAPPDVSGADITTKRFLDMQRQLDVATETAQAWRSKYDRAVLDIQRIGNALVEEAQRRDWCAEFDEWVEAINETLATKLPNLREVYEISLCFNIQMRGRESEAGIVTDYLEQSADRWLARINSNIPDSTYLSSDYNIDVTEQ